MNRRIPNFYMARDDFAHAYLCLDTFASIYEDGADTAAEMQRILCETFAEEHKAVLNYESAQSIIAQVRNSRGAGRKPLLTEAMRSEIRHLKDGGCSVKKIAADYNVSVRTVYDVCQ